VQVDAKTTPQPLEKIGELARGTQAAGFSGLLFTGHGRTAYLNAAVASQAARDLELSTSPLRFLPGRRGRVVAA